MLNWVILGLFLLFLMNAKLERLVSDFKFFAMTDGRIDEFETPEPSLVTSEGITEVCAS